MDAPNPTVVLTGRRRVEVEARPAPAPGPGEVLVRTHASLLSTGTELTLYRGDGPPGSVWDRMAAVPRRMGYSNVGTVVAVGPGVDAGWVGRVAHNHGAHQALTLAPAAKLAALPGGLDEAPATAASLGKVAMNGLRRGGATWGETLAVVGLGLLGHLAVRLGLALGARAVVAVERVPFRLGLLPDDPRVVALRGRPQDLVGAVAEATGGRMADLVVEATGNPEAIPGAPGLVRDQGRVVMLSSPRGPSTFDFHDLCNRRSLALIGAHGASHPPPGAGDLPWTSARHGELFLAWLASGRLSASELITHRLPFDRAPEAYALLDLQSDTAMGVLLEWP